MRRKDGEEVGRLDRLGKGSVRWKDMRKGGEISDDATRQKMYWKRAQTHIRNFLGRGVGRVRGGGAIVNFEIERCY